MKVSVRSSEHKIQNIKWLRKTMKKIFKGTK